MRVLGALAAKGRFIDETVDPTTGTLTIRDSNGEKTATCGVAAVAAARDRGWVGRAMAGSALSLTTAGRDALRRSRSAISALRAEARGNKRAGPVAPHPPRLNARESPLTWLASRNDRDGRRMLSESQVAAGERLRSDLYFARLTPRVTMGWSGLPPSDDYGAAAGFGDNLTDTVVAARARVGAALATVGPELADILIDVCGHLRGLEEISSAEGWPRRAARLLLQRALSALARHYGLEPEVGVETMIGRRLRHWGTADYRPTIARRAQATDDAQDE